jgi:hypothetical protein
MRRALVFLLLGPMLGVCGAALVDVAAGRAVNGDFEGAVMAYFFGLAVSAATGPIDGYLARIVPIYLRAPLTAIVGATIAVGLILAMGRMMLPPQILMQFAITGAVCMGVCSVFSNAYRNEEVFIAADE